MLPDTTTTAEKKQVAEGLLAALPKVDRVAAIDARLADIAAATKAARLGDLPKPENAERLIAWLRRRRARFELGHGFHGPVRDLLRGFSRSDTKNPSIPDAEYAFDLLVWMLGPGLEASAAEAVNGLDYVEGLSGAERQSQTSALADERTRLVAERARLVDEALATSGGQVNVTHLPETLAARETEAARQEEDDAARRQQEFAATKIDRRHADELLARSQGTKSKYIDSGGAVR